MPWYTFCTWGRWTILRFLETVCLHHDLLLSGWSNYGEQKTGLQSWKSLIAKMVLLGGISNVMSMIWGWLDVQAVSRCFSNLLNLDEDELDLCKIHHPLSSTAKRLDERQTGFEKAMVRDCHDQQLLSKDVILLIHEVTWNFPIVFGMKMSSNIFVDLSRGW